MHCSIFKEKLPLPVLFIIFALLSFSACNDDDESLPDTTPVAAFEASEQEIFVWQEVHFQNQSENFPHTFEWIFEGAQRDTSYSENVTTLFIEPGTFDVQLIAANNFGADTLVKKDFITVKLHQHSFGSFTDPRNNREYQTIDIEGSTWMAENLNYQVEGAIPYDYHPDNHARYGLLYSNEAAESACPAGWRLPLAEEVELLAESFGGSENAGGKLKIFGTEYWDAPNKYASNATGFSAKAGGAYYSEDLGFQHLGRWAIFWTATPAEDKNSNYHFSMQTSSPEFHIVASDFSERKLSVRCIKE